MIARNVLVTGAGRGLGFALTKALCMRGHRVWAGARDEGARARLTSLGAATLNLDVANDESVTRAAQVLDTPIDAIVNNAAIYVDRSAAHDHPLAGASEIVKQSLDVNLLGAVRVTEHFLPKMSRTGRRDLIQVSSRMGALAPTSARDELFAPGYRISKTALNAFTVHLSRALTDEGVFVNSVCPGWCRTDMGGGEAPRSAEQGIRDIVWILETRPEWTGCFIADQRRIEF